MANKEILAQLKKSYENLQDIRENGCYDHCDGQLNKENIDRLEKSLNEIAWIYSDLREGLTDDECEVVVDGETYVIGHTVSEDYNVPSEDDIVTCGDLDYYWYEDYEFLTK